MVMPRSSSRMLESIETPSCATPVCRKSASVKVVFPWSTWAMIAMLRISIQIKKLRAGDSLHYTLFAPKNKGISVGLTLARLQKLVQFRARLGAHESIAGVASLGESVFHLKFLHRAKRERAEACSFAPRRAGTCGGDACVDIGVEDELERAYVFTHRAHRERPCNGRARRNGRCRCACCKHVPNAWVLPAIKFEYRDAAHTETLGELHLLPHGLRVGPDHVAERKVRIVGVGVGRSRERCRETRYQIHCRDRRGCCAYAG